MRPSRTKIHRWRLQLLGYSQRCPVENRVAPNLFLVLLPIRDSALSIDLKVQPLNHFFVSRETKDNLIFCFELFVVALADRIKMLISPVNTVIKSRVPASA